MRSLANYIWIIVGFVAVTATAAAVGTRSSRPAAPTAAPVFAPFGEPLPGIDDRARAQFERGRAVATRRFAPSEGLGPTYSATSCRSCHEKPVTGGGASRYRATPLEAHSQKTFIAAFEHHFSASSVDPGHGRPRPMHLPLPFFGIGLLAEIPAEEIIARADPSDRNHDGISGKVNFERGYMGRFGRKAQMATLQGFVRLALLDHMGVTSSPAVIEKDAPLELPTRDADRAPDPELGTDDLADLVAFVSLLAPPAPDPPTRETREGEAAFRKVGCAGCHTPSLRGPRGLVPAYTDLLLHDMGEGLDDGVEVGEAGGSEFRTTPLWGLGAAGPYLHDGRADTLDEAIRAHGGEASGAARRYGALAERERGALLAFLVSLGGSQDRSDGLLPRNAPMAAVGALGGPLATLSPRDGARFLRGRELFDHDFRASQGLGPFFNGDACRSCHFDPVLGGAGPSDVDVIRHGIVRADGAFELPKGGDTMAHRFGLPGQPLAIDARANLFERRQTPTLFGSGLIDAISDETIRAGADPEDRDGDEVRGVVSVVSGGKVGRFGWKGQMPSLADFVEDAFVNELGMSKGELESSVHLAFDDIVFFLQNLAPPPRRTLDPEHETRGRAAFAQAGCQSCHTPELRTRNDEGVPLFSDLLLHDVAPKSERLVLQNGTRAFRTPPLWGVGATAPYFHDGMSETLDAAIVRHEGEAKRSRDRYTAMTADDRAALLVFLRSL
ncbi:di-heme oxidoredictase family protein [Pendulispora albinea]|uniref:C-type cytochrome n=1 Tax=Pendulispora albinea TaxID=2741071 RepID=A0ABZ2LYP2_9BACT